MLRSLLRYALFTGFMIFMVAVPSGGRANSPDENMSNAILKMCATELVPYEKAVADTKGKGTPPTPPVFDPPCAQCGESANPSTDSSVNSWIAEAQNPETDAFTVVAGVDREEHILGVDQGLVGGTLTSAAFKCLRQFDPDPKTVEDHIVTRLVDKTHEMYTQHKSERQTAYAGIKLLLAVQKLKEVSGSKGTALQDDATAWMQTIVDKLNDDVFTNHKYNLCATYGSTMREFALMGGNIDNTAVVETLQKLAQGIKFKISMDLHAKGSANGSQFDLAWKGTSDFTLKIDPGKSCFTPEINGNTFAVSYQNFSMTNKDGSVTLIGPHDFNATVKSVKLSLCDTSPQMNITFSDYGPVSQVQANGHPDRGDYFGGMMRAALMKIPTNMHAAGAAQNAAQQAQMNKIKAEMEAHKTDVSWMMGPQGQADMAALQRLAVSSSGMSENTISSVNAMAQTVTLNWANGTATPIDQTITFDRAGLNDQLKIKVELEQ
jgi:hypothetical protein